MHRIQDGTVSVILVNYKGVEDTLAAVKGVLSSDWPAERLEIIVVDNDSNDGSAQTLAKADLPITVVEAGANLGFAAGCNLGVRASSGEYVAFLNNDAKPHVAWITAAIHEFEMGSKVGAVASRVLDWEGKTIDYAGSAMTWYGMGYKPMLGEPAGGATGSCNVLFGTGAAMFVRRSVFQMLEGFDEKYFMFFEDVDFGWRLNLAGWQFRYAPNSIAFHKHHASMSALGEFKETYLLERNALFTIYKNLSDEKLKQVLPATIALLVRRSVVRGDLDSRDFEITRSSDNGEFLEQPLSKNALAGIYAVDQFTEHLPQLVEQRRLIQQNRKVGEGWIWRLFGDVDAPIHTEKSYRQGYEHLVNAFSVLSPPTVTKVLIVTGHPIGANPVGEASRPWEMATHLAGENDVVLLSLSEAERVSDRFRTDGIAPGDTRKFASYENWADVIILQGEAMALFDSLRGSTKTLVADACAPTRLDWLVKGEDLSGDGRIPEMSGVSATLKDHMLRADFVLAESDTQRSFLLRQLRSSGSAHLGADIDDPDLNQRIAVVPFGIPAAPPRHTKDVLRGVHPSVGAKDKIILWGGDTCNRFDPLTLIHAVALLSQSYPTVRLVFTGAGHLHSVVPQADPLAGAKQLATRLGVLGSNVLFDEFSVERDYPENLLTEVNAAACTEFAHVETRSPFFSPQTLISDYLWAEVPMVVTRGSFLADLVEKEGLGVAVEAESTQELRNALELVLFDEKFVNGCKIRMRNARQSLGWGSVLRPLSEFVRQSPTALDRAYDGRITGDENSGNRRVKPYGLAHNIRRSVEYLKRNGPVALMKKVLTRF